MKEFNRKIIVFLFTVFFISHSLWGTSYLGTKSPTEEKEIGDIVFNDGSAIPYKSSLTLSTEQKKAAVAVIFYVGKDCSDDGTKRTLGIGLRYSQIKLQWCSFDAAARHEYIDTIYRTVKNGSQSFVKIGEWLRNHSKIDDTENKAKYSAFYYAQNYDMEVENLGVYTKYWYLPSEEEARAFTKENVLDPIVILNDVCKLCDLPSFQKCLFWISSQDMDPNRYSDASCFYFFIETSKSEKHGCQIRYSIHKANYCNVCVIREFD